MLWGDVKRHLRIPEQLKTTASFSVLFPPFGTSWHTWNRILALGRTTSRFLKIIRRSPFWIVLRGNQKETNPLKDFLILKLTSKDHPGFPLMAADGLEGVDLSLAECMGTHTPSRDLHLQIRPRDKNQKAVMCDTSIQNGKQQTYTLNQLGVFLGRPPPFSLVLR